MLDEVEVRELAIAALVVDLLVVVDAQRLGAVHVDVDLGLCCPSASNKSTKGVQQLSSRTEEGDAHLAVVGRLQGEVRQAATGAAAAALALGNVQSLFQGASQTPRFQ